MDDKTEETAPATEPRPITPEQAVLANERLPLPEALPMGADYYVREDRMR